MRDEPAIRQRLQPYLPAEPIAQEHACLERLAGIAVEPLGDLPAVERGGLRQHRQHLGGLLGFGLRGLQFPALALGPVDGRL